MESYIKRHPHITPKDTKDKDFDPIGHIIWDFPY